MNKKRKYPNSFFLPFATIIIVAFFSFSLFDLNPKPDFDFSKINPQLIDTVLAIDEFGVFALARVHGQTGTTPKAFYQGKWLIKNSSNEDLFQLLDYPDGTIKALAFNKLLRRKDKRIVEALIEISDDEYWVYEGGGCVSIPIAVGEFCLNKMGYALPSGRPPPPPPYYRIHDLTIEQLEFVQTKILEVKNKLNLP